MDFTNSAETIENSSFFKRNQDNVKRSEKICKTKLDDNSIKIPIMNRVYPAEPEKYRFAHGLHELCRND